MTTGPLVAIETRGHLGMITLDRADRANSLSLEMLQCIDSGLMQFASNSSIDAVLVRGSGRSFSSGGDLLEIVGQPPGGAFDEFRRKYFSTEYELIYRIHDYPKPYIALVDGLAMGGGCGLALHGTHVIVSERTLLAMPETAIGHFPDVGATWFLNKLPGEMGVYVGLRGLRMNASDLMAFNLATHLISSDDADQLLSALGTAYRLDRSSIDEHLAQFARQPEASVVVTRQKRVDELFAAATVEEICDRLSNAEESWAQAALSAIRQASPLSLKVSLKMLREGRGLSIVDVLKREYRICQRITAGADFREGVRSLLIDKDHLPSWQPSSLELVDDEAVAACFLPLVAEPLELTLGSPWAMFKDDNDRP